jgi:hypothetical protein
MVLAGWMVAAAGIALGQTAVKSLNGLDGATGITYRLLSVPGKGPNGTPELAAQCTKTAEGKMRFELLVNPGGAAEELAFYAPWSAKEGGVFAPSRPKTNVTMEFLGYVQEKPVKRQWVMLEHPAGWMEYNTPSGGSSNMEDISLYLRYLLALPVLRLSTPSLPAISFDTTALLQAVKAEPVCAAAKL